jgi:hypothetical protein
MTRSKMGSPAVQPSTQTGALPAMCREAAVAGDLENLWPSAWRLLSSSTSRRRGQLLAGGHAIQLLEDARHRMHDKAL